MKLLDSLAFEHLATNSPKYYEQRKTYHLYAAQIIRLNNINGNTLELGARHIPIVLDADIMDVKQHELAPTVRYLQDCTVTPWTIGNKAYTMFIAMQVLEHLTPHQVEVCKEIQRVAQWSLLSIPYLWAESSEPNHAGLNHDTLKMWTGLVPVYAEVCQHRLMCLYHHP